MNVARGAVCTLGEDTALGENSDSAKLVDEVKAVNQYVEVLPAGENGTISTVTLDLGSSYPDIDCMKLYRYWDNPARRYLGTVIAVSETEDFTNSEIVYNSDKENVFGLGVGTEALYQETSAGHEIVLPEGVSGRYVRIYMQGYKETAGTFTTNHLVEFEVYANGMTVQAGVVTGCERMGTVEVDKTIVPYGQSATLTAHPNPGYAFEGWYEEQSGSEASRLVNAQKCHGIQEVTEHRRLYAKFDVKADHKFTVRVLQKHTDANGNISWSETNHWDGKYNSAEKMVDLGEVVLPEGKTFSHWEEKDKPGIVFSAVRDLRFRIPGDLELIPVFSDDSSAGQTQMGHAEISDTCLIRNESDLTANAKVRFVGKLFIPKDWTLNETGLLWTGKPADIVDELRMDESTGLPKTNMKKIVATTINVSHQFSATVSNVPLTKTVRGVIYAKMTDPEGGEHWYYSKEEAVTHMALSEAAAAEE